MFNAATRSIVIASLALALSGCASWRAAFQNWRLGPQPGAAQPAVAAIPAVGAEAQKAMDRLYADGAGALARDDIDATITAWRQYVALAPTHGVLTTKVRGYLTLLDRESAKRFAKRVAAREKTTPYQQTDRLHLALFPFLNQGPNAGAAANASFNRAVMAMITTDLSRVPSITVLEREKVDHLVQELKLSDSGLTDRATVLAQGRLLGAGTVIAGSVYNAPGAAGPGSGRYRINTAVSDVKGGQVVGLQEADGGQAEFFTLQKRIVYGILQTLEIKEVPPGVHRVHTRSWEAYASFAAGLKLLAEDRFDDARKAFRAALQFDPGFALAEEAFLGTPSQGATFEGMRTELRANAQPGALQRTTP